VGVYSHRVGRPQDPAYESVDLLIDLLILETTNPPPQSPLLPAAGRKQSQEGVACVWSFRLSI